jgi:phosphinothricin acetyltransferase
VNIHIRNATEDDLPAILAIYNEVIANTTAVYSERVVSLDDRRNWFDSRRSARYPVLVAVTADATNAHATTADVATADVAIADAAASADAIVGAGVVGFASFGDFRAWPCYRHTVELSVHVAAGWRGAGIGRALISALLPLAAALGNHVMIAAVDADNAASIHLHEGLGFERVGHLREVGRKFDRWLDLVFLQRYLG